MKSLPAETTKNLERIFSCESTSTTSSTPAAYGIRDSGNDDDTKRVYFNGMQRRLSRVIVGVLQVAFQGDRPVHRRHDQARHGV